jgi:hypothetical protein
MHLRSDRKFFKIFIFFKNLKSSNILQSFNFLEIYSYSSKILQNSSNLAKFSCTSKIFKFLKNREILQLPKNGLFTKIFLCNYLVWINVLQPKIIAAYEKASPLKRARLNNQSTPYWSSDLAGAMWLGRHGTPTRL